jgi:CheY-like chemotaxis protein
MLDRNALILIVDDMKFMRTAIKRCLNSIGYSNIIEAANGAEAVIKVKDNDVDFVLMDIVMPIMTGIEAFQKIREFDSQVPIAMLTSIADQKTIDDCRTNGVFDYILKPLNAVSGPDILKKALEKVFS